ncbi:glycosyltransferase family protein [Horticoccus sp. 23ND18S-11]|uniref:glycosyltransferase family protein n=1 Tax=Horticoccus sp. 23ND18S-11 TaxID=3391832 RepID=UPI0039C8DDCC
MDFRKIAFLYEGRTNSVFRDPFLGVPAALRALGVECFALDLRQVSVEKAVQSVRHAGVDLVLQVTRTPGTAWAMARARAGFGCPYVLWNLEEPNATAGNDLLSLAAEADLYVTIDARMVRWHRVPVLFLPLFFDESVYYERHLPRDLSAAFLIQYSTPRLRRYLRPLVAALEERPDSCVSTYRPMARGRSALHRLAAATLDRLPLGLASVISLVAQRSGAWRQDAAIRPQGFFVNRDEEEKAFVYGRAKIGVGFSRVFGPWEDAFRAQLPGYEADAAGNFVQIKSRHFEITGAGAMLLSDASPELDALFEPGREYVAYDYTAPADFHDKLRFYLEHDEARERIARAGYARAHRDHTLTRRLSTLLAECRRRW